MIRPRHPEATEELLRFVNSSTIMLILSKLYNSEANWKEKETGLMVKIDSARKKSEHPKVGSNISPTPHLSTDYHSMCISTPFLYFKIVLTLAGSAQTPSRPTVLVTTRRCEWIRPFSTYNFKIAIFHQHRIWALIIIPCVFRHLSCISK